MGEGWRETKVACLIRAQRRTFDEDPQPDPPECFSDPEHVAKLAETEALSVASVDPHEITADAMVDESPTAPAEDWRPKRLVRTVVASMAESQEFGRQMLREAKRRAFLKAAAKAVKTTGTVLLLIGISSMFGYLIGLYGVAELTGQALAATSSSPWVIFLWVNVILFVLGTFLDMAATILICTPIFLPICQQYGMSTEQFGIVMLINCALGLNTPPVGTTQFVGCTIGEISVGEVMKTIWPFYGALIAALMLVTYVPGFAMWLPNLLLK
mgnify:CR=1 FL=1